MNWYPKRTQVGYNRLYYTRLRNLYVVLKPNRESKTTRQYSPHTKYTCEEEVTFGVLLYICRLEEGILQLPGSS